MTTFGKPKLTVVEAAPHVKRTPRKPQHSFQLRHRPYQITPFMLAPVIPGETMKNLLMQARVVTQPIANPLIGWWIEYYFFYVKLRDLNNRELMESMILDLNTDMAAANDAVAKPQHYHHSGINYTKLCLDRVVDEYFRDEGEDTTTNVLDNLPLAQIQGNSWLDSLYAASELPTGTVDVDGTEDEFDLAEFEGKYQTWLLLRQQKMTEMDFEDYLASYGVRRSLAQKNKPELIRFVREWSYPSNTVEPSSGVPSSAVSWSVAERADKDRFFSEPGFLFGVTVARPKVYLSGQRESAAHLMSDTFAWLPAVLRDNPETSLRKVAQGTGPLGGVFTTDDYWVDLRDLLMYGDQFVNFTLDKTDAGLVALPKTTHKASRYVSGTDIDALFSGDNKYVAQDGIVSLNILGTQVDHT